MQMTKMQQTIITTNEPHVLVSSSAAAGKTECLVQRLNFLLKQGVKPSEIVAITFTNNAASEIYKRLGNPVGLFVGTVHSYANYLLRGHAIDTTEIIQEARFDDLFEEIKKHPQCFKHVAHLISDESQDISLNQFEFYELINPDNYMYFYDIKQTLFEWRDAQPQYLINLAAQPDVVVYTMTQNFRNLPDILQFAKKFLYRLGPAYSDNSIAMRKSEDGSRVHVLEGDYTPQQAVDVLLRANDTLKNHWKDWFILCRTNADVLLFKTILDKRGIPNDSFKQAEFDNIEIEQKMNEDTIKILTVHSAKGLAAPNVLVYNVRAYKDEEARICYVAATRARDHLIWAKMPSKKKKAKVVNWE